MKTTGKKSLFIFLVIVIVASLWWKNVKPSAMPGFKTNRDTMIRILNRWKMPHVLKEISGISWLGNNRFACVQDNIGKIFIYNSEENKIEKEIPVIDLNDFEGIAVVGSTAYLLRADGTLWEVKRYKSKHPRIKEYHTFFGPENNMEGLCYDPVHKKLLLAVKTKDPFSKDQKGIYAFDLKYKKTDSTPVYRINLADSIWGNETNHKKMRPSDLAINPITGEVYILDGEKPKLVVLTAKGIIKSIYKLPEEDFRLPEGIAFTGNGRLFISNEGRLGKGSILEVCIDD